MMGDVIGFLKKMFYHGCNSTENSNAKTDHSFWVYPALKPTVNSWDTHLPVGLYCNNHAFLGSCVEDMSLTEFECMGHSSEEDSAVVYTGALPLPLPQSRSVSPALSSASDCSNGAAVAPTSHVFERTVSPSSDAEDLADAIATGDFSSYERRQTTQDNRSSNDKVISELFERVAKLEQADPYSTLYRIIAELVAVIVLAFYFLRVAPTASGSSSRDVDL